MNADVSFQRVLEPVAYSVSRVPAVTSSLGWNALIFVAAHIPLALLMKQYPLIATLHAAITLIVGLRWAISGSCLRQVAYVGAYITAAEVLWRMTDAPIPWEFSKYGASLIFILALLRNGRFRMPLLAVLYFALLLPAIAATAMNEYIELDFLRKVLSFHLSGPFALMACTWFFSHLKLTSAQLEKVFLTFLGPSVAIAVITVFTTVTAENLQWSTNSNVITSGGYGPNQVSAALGLGALMALLLLLKNRANMWEKALIFLVMAFLAIQSALTFSRGGLVGAAGSAVIALLFLSRDREVRLRIVLISATTLLLANFVVLPRLESLTGGALAARYGEISTTGRTEIALSDLSMWNENPVFGVGVGMSFFRKTGWKAAHTEFTRLLAEHGLFGLTAIILLLVAAWQRLSRARIPQEKAIVAAMFTWSFLFMLDKAMRLVAPAFAFGLAFAVLQSEERNRTVLRPVVNLRRAG